jgi:hypothetical protein
MSRLSHRLSRTFVVGVASLLFAAGCRDIVELLRLSVGVKKEFGQQARVELFNRRHLIIRLENSPLAGRPDEAKVARRVAEFARDHFPRYRQLDDVQVVFEARRHYGPVGYARGTRGYTFTRAELGEPRR